MLKTRSPIAVCLSLAFVLSSMAPLWAGGPSNPNCVTRIPDGLDLGNCCEKVTLTLPAFPKVVDGPGKDTYICFDDCEVDQTFQVDACWEAPIEVIADDQTPFCGYFTSQVTLTLCNAEQTTFTGNLTLLYSRTFIEQPSPSLEYQVWRFLVNGDLVVNSELTPCPVPPCAASFNGKVRFWGYIDYAENLDTNEFSYAYALNHDCDVIDHASHPTLNFGRSGTFHPTRSYTFVGPGSFFVPSVAVPAESGPIVAEVLRPIDLRAQLQTGDICWAEEPLLKTSTLDPELFCYCGGTTTQYARSQFCVTTVCGTALATDPTECPNGFVSKSIGFWAPLSLQYPGAENLRINIASYENQQVCQPSRKFDYFYGVTTKGGWPTFTLTGTAPGVLTPVPNLFIDQSSSLKFNLKQTKNVRFWSDFVLNLNVDCQ